MSFPCRHRRQLDDYIAYIGFDPLTAQAQDKAQAETEADKPKPQTAQAKTLQTARRRILSRSHREHDPVAPATTSSTAF